MELIRSRRLILAAFAAALVLVATAAALLSQRRAPPACAEHEFEGARFLVCAFDARHHDLRLASRGASGAYLRSFEALAAELGPGAHVRFAMNGGMYNDRGAPIGLYIEDGEEQHPLRLTDGPGNFHMKPNGVFWQGMDGALHVDRSETFAATRPSARWATQSGPMLVIDGALHPRFAPDGESRFIRNGVGVRDAHTAYFVISRSVVSFGKFARFFRDALHCRDALFLDGAVSSLWAPDRNRSDHLHELGPMVVALDRD